MREYVAAVLCVLAPLCSYSMEKDLPTKAIIELVDKKDTPRLRRCLPSDELKSGDAVIFQIKKQFYYGEISDTKDNLYFIHIHADGASKLGRYCKREDLFLMGQCSEQNPVTWDGESEEEGEAVRDTDTFVEWDSPFSSDDEDHEEHRKHASIKNQRSLSQLALAGIQQLVDEKPHEKGQRERFHKTKQYWEDIQEK